MAGAKELVNVQKKVIEIVAAQVGRSPDEITRDSVIAELPDADSLDLIEILMEIEDGFGLIIQDADAGQWRTVGDAIDYLVKSGEPAH